MPVRKRANKKGQQDEQQKNEKSQQRSKPGCKAKPWNFGVRFSISRAQHVFVQRKDVPLWLAALVFVAGPLYAVALYLGMVTGRRVSELLRLRGRDFVLSGGGHSDFAHIVIQCREDEKDLPGLGKVAEGLAIARIGDCVVDSIRGLLKDGLCWECLPVLEEHREKHKALFDKVKPLCRTTFRPAPLEEDALWFPAARKSKQPWRTRQSIWHGVRVTRDFLYKVTGRRCFNPAFLGAHVHVHGATRHTNAALLMTNPNSTQKAPSQTAILELQQRTDVGTFVKHYTHAAEDELTAALVFGSIGSPFKAQPSSGQTEGSTPQVLPEVANRSGPGSLEKDSAEAFSEHHVSTCAATEHDLGLAEGIISADVKGHLAEMPGGARLAELEKPFIQEPASSSGTLPSEVNLQENDRVEAGAQTPSAKQHCSRNAWRKAKRRAGLAQHKAKEMV
ncbi:unnamed protein product [Symbiodinium sp. CCMP2592]|nr:unnamed protein product [Symbiodinium sp. CCMP2592]CAE7221754.1 unnamed protein product [Symbiodinium sp. CCMP2592]